VLRQGFSSYEGKSGRIGNYFEALFWAKIEDKVKQKNAF